MKFSKNLRTLREAEGMTQQELAKKLEVSLRCVQLWEKGEREPRIASILKITTMFGVRLEDMLFKQAIRLPDDKSKVKFEIE